MRLIDAAVLMGKCNCKRNCSDCDFYTDGGSWCNGEVFGITIMQMPTIDAVPVRHGHWGKGHEMMTCTNCCEQFDLYFKNDFNYCPNCGAKMDLEE